MKGLELKCDEKWANGFRGSYKGYSLSIERDHPNKDWYIMVISPHGCMAYDGYWRDSERTSVGKAIKQAIAGAMIDR